MDTKALLLAITLIITIIYHQVEAEFYFNYVYPKTPEELEARDLKCVPGRTVIRVTEKEQNKDNGSSEEDNDYDARRSHMNSGRKEESCKVCICSVEGKDEFCSERPAVNVNECLRLAMITKELQKNGAYELDRGLAYRIRRDMIWHNDEIPYEPKAKCRRGHSFYTNNKNANDTDIDISSDIESLLDYADHDVCMYCVCAVHGRGLDCINRDVWICHYYRYIRMKGTMRDVYARLFQQDRPTYFRQISWRLRRTMDDGIYDFQETVASPNKNRKCIPFVSEYSDCNENNLCTGCKNCACNQNGEWACEDVKQCPGDEGYQVLNEQSIDDALENIERGLQYEIKKERKNPNSPFVPAPWKETEEPLIGEEDFLARNDNIDAQLVKLMTLRKKRSVGIEPNKTEDSIKFYHVVDEINEDILKNDNKSGTIQARRFQNIPKASRRTGISDNESLLIDFNEPKSYDPHLTDNKIDISGHSEDKYVKQENEKIHSLIGNHTVKQKDKELSKLIVNELKNGSELIGDRNAPIMSNITFTPENDTLTAMAFIAGNLLNQLWNMERDSSEESKNTEDLKQEKIADLLDLFKEPLNIRQENFLKNALEQLSVAVNKDKVLKNVTLCDKIEESRRLIEEQNAGEDVMKETVSIEDDKHDEVEQIIEPKNEAAAQAVSKIGDVLNLIEKFRLVHKTLNNLKEVEKQDSKPNEKVPKRKPKTKTVLTDDESASLNVFGNILEKITKLLIPPKKSKKIVKSMKNHHLLAKSSSIAQTIKSQYGIDIGNSTLTTKDKIILDYLNTVKRHPSCIFHSAQDESRSFNVEGDILLNLAQFFKIKSYMDLMKLLDPGKNIARSDNNKLKLPEEVTTQSTTVTTTSELTSTTTPSTKLAQTKERLKDHIKSIIDDLKELQEAKGFPTRNISLADTLPCIYNLLNADKENHDQLSKKYDIDPEAKISSIFNSLKRDLLATPTRRSGAITGPRPKSAVVWERMVRRFDRNGKAMNRRSMDSKKPKSFEEIKKMIKLLEQPAKTYKSEVVAKGVRSSKRLSLLKNLNEETKKYIETLEEIKNLLPNMNKLTVEQRNDLKDFIYNAIMNINLNSKVAKSVNKVRREKDVKEDVELISPRKVKAPKEYSVKKQPLRSFDVSASKNGARLTRDEIINQLIRNRMQGYIKVKESKGLDLGNDINYTIAKKILNYLDTGNYNLARDLYKYIVNQREGARNVSGEYVKASTTTKYFFGYPKEPLLQFEQPTTQSQWSGRNSWLKQLMNLKKI